MSNCELSYINFTFALHYTILCTASLRTYFMLHCMKHYILCMCTDKLYIYITLYTTTILYIGLPHIYTIYTLFTLYATLYTSRCILYYTILMYRYILRAYGTANTWTTTTASPTTTIV